MARGALGALCGGTFGLECAGDRVVGVAVCGAGEAVFETGACVARAGGVDAARRRVGDVDRGRVCASTGSRGYETSQTASSKVNAGQARAENRAFIFCKGFLTLLGYGTKLLATRFQLCLMNSSSAFQMEYGMMTLGR